MTLFRLQPQPFLLFTFELDRQSSSGVALNLSQSISTVGMWFILLWLGFFWLLGHNLPRPQLWLLEWNSEDAHCALIGFAGQPILGSQRIWSFGKDLRICLLLRRLAELLSQENSCAKTKNRDYTCSCSQGLSFRTDCETLRACVKLCRVVSTTKGRWSRKPQWDRKCGLQLLTKVRGCICQDWHLLNERSDYLYLCSRVTVWFTSSNYSLMALLAGSCPAA